VVIIWLKSGPDPSIISELVDYYAVGDIKSHEEVVASLAVKIFDCMADTINLSLAWRDLLEQAARVHDIGYAINPREHDRYTHYLIMHHFIADRLPDNLRSLLAQVAGSHRLTIRKSLKKQASAIQEKALLLIAILRVADTLAYPYPVRVEVQNFDWDGKRLIVGLRAGDQKAVEKRLDKKGQLFREIFDCDLLVNNAQD
jgi:exopolyphosphatase/guanosine-5'-triphosphate,3'-diphosphate pyrophosphatase